MICENLNDENRTADISVRYDCLFSENINDLVKAGKVINNGLKERKRYWKLELLKKRIKSTNWSTMCS